MGKRIDLTGKRFGSLTVIKESGSNKFKSRLWECVCDCGTVTRIATSALTSGNSKSCGCGKRLQPARTRKDYTGYKVGILTVIGEPKQRRSSRRREFICLCECGNQTIVSQANLIGKRVKSCGCYHPNAGTHQRTVGGCHDATYLSWRGAKERCENPNHMSYRHYGGRGIQMCDRWRYSFEAFLEDMGERPGSEYTIERNDTNGHYEPSNCRWATRTEQARNTRSNPRYEFDGKVLTLPEWAEITNISVGTLRMRLRRGVTIGEALTTSVKRSKQSPIQ